MSGFLPNPIHDQQQVAHHFFLDGSIMFLGNLIVGLLVYSKYPGPTPYSRLEAISYGAPIILAGLILTQTQIIGKLNTVELFFVWIGQESAWPMWIVQILDGLCLFWGTKQSNKSAAEEGKTPSVKTWQENLVLAAHYATALGIPAWAIIVKCLLYPRV